MGEVKRYSIVAVIIALVVGLVAGSVATYLAAPAKTMVKTVAGAPTTITTAVTKTVTITPAAKPPKYTIYYVSHGGPANVWWATVVKGAKAAADLLGVKVVYLGPEKFSIKALVDLVEGAIAKKPDALIVTITSYEALDEPLRRAIEMGIPVFAVNVADYRPEEERIPYLGYIGQDEVEAGRVFAEAVFRLFKEKVGRLPKRAVIGIHEPGHVGLEMRAKGIIEKGEALGLPPIEKIDITLDFSKEVEIFKAYLEKHPDTELILTLGPQQAYAAMKAIQEKGLRDRVLVGTFDVDERVVEGIKEGMVLCAISQQPFAQGFLPVVAAYLYLEYGIQVPVGNIPLHVRTGPVVITKDNVAMVLKQIEVTGGA